MNSERGREIQAKAEHAREAGQFEQALSLTDQATVVYAQDDDIQGLSEVQSSRLLTFRHLFEQTEKDSYLILAKHAAICGVELAEKGNVQEALSIPYFNLGKACESLGEIEDAVTYYKKAIESKVAFPGIYHNRAGVLADMKGHLAIAQYRLGTKDALSDAVAAIDELQESDEPKYNKDVWLSGAHMRIAEAIIHTDRDEAKVHIQKAQEIIDSNKELVLREKQLRKLRNKLSI